MSPTLVAELVGDRPRPPEQWEALFAGSWPAWVDADPVAAAALPRVRHLFGHLEVAITELPADGGPARLAAAAWGVPLAWDGEHSALPGGYTDSLVRSLAVHDAHLPPDALVVCAAQVRPDLGGSGLAARLLGHLADVAAGHGLDRVVVPLRPTGKHLHPLVPIEEYASWRRPDGTAHDPWLRTHERMGAFVVGAVAASQVFEGTTAQWQRWTGVALPTSGDHVVPGALAPLHLDRVRDVGRLVEPGIWVRHR